MTPRGPAIGAAFNTALLAAACIGAGCASDPTRGYSFASTYDERIRTVSVPVFENETFLTGLEVDLTDAIVKRIQATTPWRVSGPNNADTTLRGRLVDSEIGLMSGSPVTGLTQEQFVRLRVNFSWEDNRSGAVLASRESFAAAATVVPERGDAGQPGERLEIGQRAAIDELAEAIVNEMRSNW